MPEINLKADTMTKQIALDVLLLKIGEELTFDFKDEPMAIKRIK